MSDLGLEEFENQPEPQKPEGKAAKKPKPETDEASASQIGDGGPAASKHGESEETERLQALHSVPVDIQVVLGHARLPVNQLLKLGRGAVVEIDRKVGEAVDVHINNQLVARAEVVIVDDNKLGITLTEIVGAPPAVTH